MKSPETDQEHKDRAIDEFVEDIATRWGVIGLIVGLIIVSLPIIPRAAWTRAVLGRTSRR